MRDPVVFDKPKYHIEGDWPSGLAQAQAYVHIGFYLGWLIDSGGIAQEMEESFGDELAAFRDRRVAGSRVLRVMGHALASDMIAEPYLSFTRTYYDRLYYRDYANVLAFGAATIYAVSETWEAYARIRSRLEARFQEWRSARNEQR